MKDAQPRPFHIRTDCELVHPQVIDLLREHLADMHAESPPDKVFALDLSGLRRPDITFLNAWRLGAESQAGEIPGPDGGEQLVAMGALKELTPTTATAGGHGELRSMRTSARHLRQGAAQAILTELLAHARQRGCARVSLETGSTPGCDPALAMYQIAGFEEYGSFADYRGDPFSRFLTLSATN
jgi:putative acetyltransferase